MTEQTDIRALAKQLYDAQSYEEAGKLFHQLWDEQGDAFSGGRYALCLRRCGHAKAALTIARRVADKYPDDIYVRREVVWALYDAEFKPAKEKGDLNALLRIGQQIVELTDEELPVRLVSFAIIDLAKDKMKWDVVSAWCDRLDPQKLSDEVRTIGGRRVISEREQWYFAKIKSLVQLKRWDEARVWAIEAREAFPRKEDFARWAAQALAGQGHISEAIVELEKLARQERPPWYLLNDLAELNLQSGQAEEAYRLACRAALAPGEDKAKVGLFVLLSQSALETEQFDVAARHVTLSRLVRAREGWSIPGAVTQLEVRVRQTVSAWPDVPDEIARLFAQCRKDWEAAVPPDLRPQPREKRQKNLTQTDVRTDQVFHTGRIKMYNADRGFGFITPDNGTDDLFFHISDVRGIDSPAPGVPVQYQVGEGRKGPAAVDVRAAADEK